MKRMEKNGKFHITIRIIHPARWKDLMNFKVTSVIVSSHEFKGKRKHRKIEPWSTQRCPGRGAPGQMFYLYMQSIRDYGHPVTSYPSTPPGKTGVNPTNIGPTRAVFGPRPGKWWRVSWTLTCALLNRVEELVIFSPGYLLSSNYGIYFAPLKLLHKKTRGRPS